MDELKTEEHLIEWTIQHVKHRDLMKKTLVDYKILKNYISFEFKDKTHMYYLHPELDDSVLSELKNEHLTFVCLNTKSNVSFLVNNWEKLIGYPKLNFIFADPATNQCWILVPNIHDRISERKKLKSGLISLYESI